MPAGMVSPGVARPSHTGSVRLSLSRLMCAGTAALWPVDLCVCFQAASLSEPHSVPWGDSTALVWCVPGKERLLAAEGTGRQGLLEGKVCADRALPAVPAHQGLPSVCPWLLLNRPWAPVPGLEDPCLCFSVRSRHPCYPDGRPRPQPAHGLGAGWTEWFPIPAASPMMRGRHLGPSCKP